SSLPTPPNTMYGLPGPSPYTAGHHYPTYVTSTKPTRAREHHFLEYHSRPVVDYDMAQHPSTIQFHHHHIPSHVLYEAATTPALPSMMLKSPYLPWTVKVYASNGSYVTLFDVFDSIYRTMYKGITSHEFATLPSDHERQRATRAYEARYSRHHSSRSREEEKRQGMKRIDFLMGHTIFSGITPTHQPDVWTLNSR
ncbi:hypothetical protein BDQ17DRAFT_1364203, partial [Cyathus striatus]